MMRIVVDVRALQDDEYSSKGIGQHTLYIASILRSIEGAKLAPLPDPMFKPMRKGAEALFDLAGSWIDTIEGDVYINPSPLTHDTSAITSAVRKGMRTGAVVHDFIPFRQPEFRQNRERYDYYQYLVASLRHYDFLIANSDFTQEEIGRFVPDYDRPVITVHCRSRFKASDAAASDGVADPGLLRPAQRQFEGSRYVFVAAADDPRKNPEMAIRVAMQFHAVGLRVVLGGGLSEATRRRLRNLFPDQFILANPIFLPRLGDEELAEVYRRAALVLVCSRDEGFSLPIAESVALRRPVIASRIPAHSEQILDPQLMFDLDDVDGLWRAVRAALALGRFSAQLQAAYRCINYVQEQEALRALVVFGKHHAHPTPPATQCPIIVGPSFEKPTGIAMFNRLMVAQCRTRDADFEYVDVDDLPPDEFYDWLLANAMRDIIYVMGNNNVFHKNCFVALQNVPGHCILHDSRLFEFILNQDGPFRIMQMWEKRHPLRPIDVAKVVEWQRERKLLRHSFLEHVTTRARTILVHNQVLCRHIADQYSFTRVHYLPFALQMTDRELRFVSVARAKGRRLDETQPLRIMMLGETEPTKGCVEIIFAVKILQLQGILAVLSFIGKSEDPYHTELVDAAGRLGLSEQVSFTRYVPRQHYLEALAAADVVVQLRYPLFGQVSGPLADAVACGVPVVATEELANGMGLVEACECVPNVFSPLHIAGAVRRAVGRPTIARKSHNMGEYVDGLFDVCGIKRTAGNADKSAATTGIVGLHGF